MSKLPFVSPNIAVATVALLMSSFSVACLPPPQGKPAQATATAHTANKSHGDHEDRVLGTVNGVAIKRADFNEDLVSAMRDAENEMAQRQFHLLWAGVEEQIDAVLLEAAAKKSGLSVEDYRKKSIDGRLEQPSEEDVQRIYDENKDRIPVTYEQAAPIIRNQLTAQDRERLEKEMAAALRKDAQISYDLPVPQLPRYPVESGGAPEMGNADAKVTVVEFSDFQCPYCSQAREVLAELKAAFPDDVKVVYRDFPLSHHQRARPAAEAAQCAHEQEKFWPYHDLLFDNPQALSDADLRTYATKVGLDMEAFESCLKSPRPGKAVSRHFADGQRYGVEGTPAIFINGIKLIGLLPMPIMKAFVEAELAR